MTWIKLHRQIQDSEIWQLDSEVFGRDPFCRASAWIDLLLLASHNEHRTIIKNQPVKLHPGDIVASKRFLMKRWGWGSSKTIAYIQLLIDLKMISRVRPGTGPLSKSIYHIVNWDTYQGRDDASQTASQTGIRPVADRNQEGKEGIRRDSLFSSSGSSKNIEGEELSLAASASKRTSQLDVAFDCFANKFKEHLQIAYQDKRGDFIQLNRLRKTLGIKGKDSCPSDWNKACENYFASNLSDWTLADLSVRFHVFRKNPVDRFGRPNVPEEDYSAKLKREYQKLMEEDK